MTISFRATRNAGLILLVLIIIFVGLVPVFIMEKTSDLNKEISEEFFELEVAERMSSALEEARDGFDRYLVDGIGDTQLIYKKINLSLEHGENLKKLTEAEEGEEEQKVLIADAYKKVKLFKIGIVNYIQETQDDLSGVYANEMKKITLEMRANAFKALSTFKKSVANDVKIATTSMLHIQEKGRIASLGGLFFGILSGFIVAGIMAYAMNKPIRQLVMGTKKLAEGDLNYRVKIQSRDEFGQLAKAFNSMVENLHSTTISRDFLKDNERRIRKIIDSSIDAVIMMNHEGKVIDWNPQAEHIFGWSRDEVMNKRMSELIIPVRYRKRHEAGLKRFLETGEGPILNQRIEIEGLNRQGKELPIELSITSIPEGDTSIFCAYINDITGRKKIAKDLLDIKFSLDEHAIVSITDRKGVMTYANDKFCEISQYSKTELVGRDHRIVNSGYHPKEFMRELWRTITDGKVWKGEIRNKSKDGNYFWTKTSIIPFLNEEGKPEQYIGISTDITKGKLNAERLKTINKDMEEKISEVERLNKSMTGRELRIIEVKEEVNKLSEELGRPAPYKLA